MEHIQDATYLEMQTFVEQRDQIIEMMRTQFDGGNLTEDQKERIKVLLQHDELIGGRMRELYAEARDWLQQRRQAVSRQRIYEAGYAYESILMDKRK